MKKLLIGLGVAALMFGIVTNANANLITNGSFETDETTWGTFPANPLFPVDYGDWNGDKTTIVGTENGITPPDGTKMLRFDATGPDDGGIGTGSETWQWIDISTYSVDIASGSAVADLSAYFNRVSGDDKTDTAFSVSIYSYITFNPSNWTANVIDFSYQEILTDADVDTWQLSQTQFILPKTTNLLLVRIAAIENVFHDLSSEFDGHYVDNVSLTITTAPIPEPATMLLFGTGLAGLIGSRIRRKKK